MQTKISARAQALAFVTVFATLTGFGSHCAAQSPDQLIDLKDVSGRLDLSIPQSPAFTVLGVTPEKVVQSDDFRTVATSFLKGLDPNGNMQEGIAIDVRPYLLAFGDRSTLRQYRDDPFVRVASRSKLSYATASGSDASDRADRQALGINVKLWMQHDPAMGTSTLTHEDTNTTETLDACYTRQLTAASGLPATLPTDDELTDAEAQIASNARLAVTKCLAPFKEQHWNAGSVEIAIAGHRSKVGDIDEDGFGAWLGASYGIASRGQIIARASYTENMLVPVKGQTGAFSVVDASDAGLRFRYGSSRGSFMVEGLWTRSHTATLDEKYWRASLGAELMIIDDVWIQLAAGKAFSTDEFDDDPVYSGQVRFGFSEKSLFAGD